MIACVWTEAQMEASAEVRLRAELSHIIPLSSPGIAVS